MKSVALHTLGCKLNYSETSTLAKQFEDKGMKLSNYGDKSDIFVLNTCSVTDNADKECRQIIRSILRNNPETYVIVTGCYAQLQPGEIAGIEGVDLILGSKEKLRLFEYLEDVENPSCIFKEPESKIFVSEVGNKDDEIILKPGGFICDIKILGTGVQLLCRNHFRKMFQLRVDEVLLFQKLTKQEEVILSVFDYLHKK